MNSTENITSPTLQDVSNRIDILKIRLKCMKTHTLVHAGMCVCVCVFKCALPVSQAVRTQEQTKPCQVSGVAKAKVPWYFWLPQAQSDRIHCHSVITIFVSSLHIIPASM